jgi:peroxiredoxin
LSVAVAGCDRASSASPPPADASQTTVHSGTQPAAAPANPPPGPPALTETPADKLGTVPAGLGLKVGDKAPTLSLDSVTGGQQSLGDLYAQGPTFVVFYRGGWCPFCNLQIHELSNAAPEFAKRGLRLVAISVDVPTQEAMTQAKHGVPFPMLSDPKLKAHQAFHVVHTAGEGEQKVLAGFGIDLQKFSGETHKSFAVPSMFLVDKQGVVRWEHADEDFKTRPTAKQMLAVAATTLSQGSASN